MIIDKRRRLYLGILVVLGIIGIIWNWHNLLSESKKEPPLRWSENLSSSTMLHTSEETIAIGKSVHVSWKDVHRPSSRDFVAMTCGPRGSIDDHIERKSTGGKTQGTLEFKDMLMLRCPYTFIYFNFDAARNTFEAKAEITVHMKEAYTSPQQGHISFTENIDEMAVMYNTGTGADESRVQYGLDKQVLSMTASGYSTTYSANDMCHAPANVVGQTKFRDPGLQHTVILKNLAPDTRYYYRFGSNGTEWSPIYSFRSRPQEGATRAVSFLAYGDQGPFKRKGTVGRAIHHNPGISKGYEDFILHVGDLGYAKGNGLIWDQFMGVIEPFATRIPYMVGVGNHEYVHNAGGEHDPSGAEGNGFHPWYGNFAADSDGECAVPMHYRFHVPANGNGIFWYSFNYGLIHVIQMSTEHNWRKGSAQHEWLIKDLEAVDRQKTPWIVFTAHRMMYTAQKGNLSDRIVSMFLRWDIEYLLLKYRVNLVLVGHQHSYERSCAVSKGSCVASGKAPVHMTVGAGGAGTELKGFTDFYGSWSVAHGNVFGLLRVNATRTKMHCEFLLTTNGSIFDEVTLEPY